jgi:hypothetical protein
MSLEVLVSIIGSDPKFMIATALNTPCLACAVSVCEVPSEAWQESRS